MPDGKRISPDRWLAIGGIVTAIIIYLVPKPNPLFTLLLLAAVFALLFHPIWNLPWIDRTLVRRIIALTLLAVAVFVFGISIWPLKPEANSLSSRWSFLTERLAIYVGYIADLPWQCIVPSFAIGALAVALIAFRQSFLQERRWRNREQELQDLSCPEPELHSRKADDKDQIQNWFEITSVVCQPHYRDVPFIEFYFSVFNMALVLVSVDDLIDGRILFYKNNQDGELVLKRAPTMEHNHAKDD